MSYSRRRSNRGQTDCDESERGSNKPIRDARRELILNEHSSSSCVPLLLPNSNDPPQDVISISPRHHRRKSSKSTKSRTSDRAAGRRLRDAPSPSGPYSAPIPGQLQLLRCKSLVFLAGHTDETTVAHTDSCLCLQY